MRWISSLGVALAAALTLGLGAPAEAKGAFAAHLTGASEVPPVDSEAVGQAVVRVNRNGVSHTLVVARIENVVAAHIHCAPEGVNGPVGVTLFAGAPVTRSGILSAGPILDVDAGNGCGWADLDDLVDALHDGEAYVNVHTLGNVTGEIRGQLQ